MKDSMKRNGVFWDIMKEGVLPSRIASMLSAPSAQQIAFVRSLTRGQRRTETLHVPLTELGTAVFDLETTGFHYNHGDEILSFGAVRVDGMEVDREAFYSLARPGTAIPERIIELIGITPQAAEEAPALLQVLQDFMSFVDDRVLIAHGSAHDKAFLDAALWKTTRVHLGHRVLDTMMIARKLVPNRPISALDDWLRIYDIPIGRRHHALEDAKMTAQLWVKLIDHLAHTGVVTLGDLYHFLGKS